MQELSGTEWKPARVVAVRRFSDGSHLHEPGCGEVNAVETNEINEISLAADDDIIVAQLAGTFFKLELTEKCENNIRN